ncbi:MAG TPA: amidohydrolase family protein, partial [Acidimicrobiales bacterium]|nr:amidohydrolase family protein [Acidimicrobiales bacterium]
EPPPPLERGPVKLVVADHSSPDVDQVASDIAFAHDAGRAVAVHCVTREAVVVALAAWQEVGVVPGDRIEHGSVIDDAAADVMSAVGLTVVTQPSFVFERGDDYLVEVDAIDQPYLYRCAALESAGVGVAGSSDAPFADLDPWRAMRAAVGRRTRRGQLLGAGEAISPRRALELFMGTPLRPAGPPRRVEVGAEADLCLLGAPLAEALDAFDAGLVRMTLRRGVPLFDR